MAGLLLYRNLYFTFFKPPTDLLLQILIGYYYRIRYSHHCGKQFYCFLSSCLLLTFEPSFQNINQHQHGGFPVLLTI